MPSGVLSTSCDGDPTIPPVTCSRVWPPSWWKRPLIIIHKLSVGSSPHHPSAQSTSLPRCLPALSSLKSLYPPMQRSSHISYLTMYVPTKSQLSNCAQTSNFSSLFPLQHVFAYRHLKWTPSLSVHRVQDSPHHAVTSPLLPVPSLLYRLSQAFSSLPSFKLSLLSLKPAKDTLTTLRQMDLAPVLKSLLLQNNHMRAEAKLLSVTPAMHQALIHWRYSLLPKPFPLTGRTKTATHAPSHAILLITAGNPPQFFKSSLCRILDQVTYVYSVMKRLGSKTNKKAATLVANFISISKDNSTLNMILTCDMPLKLRYMLRMLTPCKWHVLCPYLHCFAYKMNRQSLSDRESKSKSSKLYLVIPLT